MTASEFWMSSDRAPKGHSVIEFKADDGKYMRRWLHHVLDANTKKGKSTSGKIGFTMNADAVIAGRNRCRRVAIQNSGGVHRSQRSEFSCPYVLCERL